MAVDLKKSRRVENRKFQSCKDQKFDGNENLLAFMYKTYANDLYAYGLSLHSDVSIVEDAIHDVFINVYTNEKRFVHIANLRSYLLTAFRNRLIFLLQGNKRYVNEFHEAYDLFAEKNSYEVWIENEEENDRKKLVSHLLSGLTRHQREAVHLRFIEGLSVDEIAEIMQINYQSAKTLLYRTVSKIRNKYNASSNSYEQLKEE